MMGLMSLFVSRHFVVFEYTWPTDDLYYNRLSLPIAEWRWRMFALSRSSMVIVALEISLVLLSCVMSEFSCFDVFIYCLTCCALQWLLVLLTVLAKRMLWNLADVV